MTHTIYHDAAYSREQEKTVREQRTADRERLGASLNDHHRQLVQTIATQTVANAEQAQATAEQSRIEAERTAHETSLTEALRTAYVAANGSEFGFTAALPRLRAAHVEAETLASVQPKPVTTRDAALKALNLRYGGNRK